MTDIATAILAIKSDAQVSISREDINQITWTELNTEMQRLQTLYDAEGWKRNRKAEYPNHNDCIHALLDGGDTLTDLQAKRTATKNKYPKT